MLIVFAFGLGAGGICLLVLACGEQIFTGLPARFWGWLRIGVGVLAIVVMIVGSSALVSEPPRPSPCHVVASELRATERDGRIDHVIFVRVRWNADGESFSLREPTRYRSYSSAARAAARLAEMAPGATFPCSFRADRPSRIYFQSPDDQTESEASGRLAWMIAALTVLGAGVWSLERARRRGDRGRIAGGERGWPGLLGAVVVIAGLALRDRCDTGLGWSVIGAGVLIVGLALHRSMRKNERVLALVGIRLVDRRSWSPAESDSDESMSIGSGVTGLWKGRRVWVTTPPGQVVIRCLLKRWPRTLGACPASRGAEIAPTTGDAAFDATVALDGADALWRPVLTHEVRQRTAALVENYGATIDGARRIAEVRLPEGRMGEVEAVLDELGALGGALPAAVRRGRSAVMGLARREPDAAVRAGHYRWLLTTGWKPALVLSTASSDRDASIAEWAQRQMGPRSIFR